MSQFNIFCLQKSSNRLLNSITFLKRLVNLPDLLCECVVLQFFLSNLVFLDWVISKCYTLRRKGALAFYNIILIIVDRIEKTICLLLLNNKKDNLNTYRIIVLNKEGLIYGI